MSGTQSHKIADKLYLVRQTVAKGAAPAKPVEVPTNHIAVIDCSGSMYSELPHIREQLKKRIPKLLKEKDTFSLLWFSGRGQYGVILEGEPVATLADLSDVNAAIDRWLKCVGLTGFKEPLESIEDLTKKLAKKNQNTNALFFMSDGWDNQSSRADVLKAAEKASKFVSSSTFVEYGNYADRQLLTAMAEKSGGNFIFAEQFDKYAPQFEAAMQKKISGAPRIEVKIEGDAVGGFAYALHDGDLITFAAAGTAAVPEDLPVLYYVSPTPIGSVVGDLNGTASSRTTGDDFDAAYAAVSLFSVRMKPEIVFPFLKALGDVTFIEQFSGCFGKQKYSAFMDAAKTAAFDPKARFTKGYDPKKVPRDDAFTVLQFLNLLQADEGNKVLLDHSEFKYNRIGRAKLDASEHLNANEKAEFEKLTSELAGEKDVKKIKALNEKLSALTANKGEALKFIADPSPEGYPVNTLTFNEDRPNVSILIRKTGTVDLSSRLPAEHKGKIPEKLQTFIFRNYAVIKDGIVNVEKLPVRLSEATFKILKTEGVVTGDYRADYDYVIDLKALPVINRDMVKQTSAKTFFTLSFELTKAQAAQKVYNGFAKELLPAKKSEGFAALYGDEAATWLKDQGFTDYSGFNPKGTVAESTDFYMAKQLKVSLKGYSSLPSLKDAKAKIASGKPNPPTALMKPYIEEVEKFLASDAYTKAAAKEQVLEAWLKGQAKSATEECRRLIYRVAQTTFSLVVGQTWFSEFSSIDENKLDIDVDGTKVACTVEMKEIEEKL